MSATPDRAESRPASTAARSRPTCAARTAGTWSASSGRRSRWWPAGTAQGIPFAVVKQGIDRTLARDRAKPTGPVRGGRSASSSARPTCRTRSTTWRRAVGVGMAGARRRGRALPPAAPSRGRRARRRAGAASRPRSVAGRARRSRDAAADAGAARSRPLRAGRGVGGAGRDGGRAGHARSPAARGARRPRRGAAPRSSRRSPTADAALAAALVAALPAAAAADLTRAARGELAPFAGRMAAPIWRPPRPPPSPTRPRALPGARADRRPAREHASRHSYPVHERRAERPPIRASRPLRGTWLDADAAQRLHARAGAARWGLTVDRFHETLARVASRRFTGRGAVAARGRGLSRDAAPRRPRAGARLRRRARRRLGGVRRSPLARRHPRGAGHRRRRRRRGDRRRAARRSVRARRARLGAASAVRLLPRPQPARRRGCARSSRSATSIACGRRVG